MVQLFYDIIYDDYYHHRVSRWAVPLGIIVVLLLFALPIIYVSYVSARA